MDIFLFQNGGRPPSWISLQVKNYVTTRCALSMSTIVPYLVTIAQTAAELLRFSVFQNGGRPPSWICWILFADRKSTWWPKAMFKILGRSDVYFRRYYDVNFHKFAYCLFATQNGVLGDFAPKHFGLSSRPQKALPCAKPRTMTYRSSKSTMATCRRCEQTKKKQKKVTYSDTSHMRPDHPRRPIAPVFGS